ncbi:glycosyltransferase [Sulfurospirillum arcachonense]|uniref:glycosyltransferase family protein n=1 Tax=Sulfurospirillum arcachonense TaxID=57666 RepID=UPI000467EDB3|nr:glycosyltransferase [Sulfurospirillum arcachonense]
MKNKKILIIGKQNHLGWIEHTINGFLSNNYEVKHFFTNKLSLKNTFLKSIYKGIKKDDLSLQLDELDNLIKNFKPNIAVFVGAFFVDKELFALCKEKKIITIGWVGDLFYEDKTTYVDILDFLYVSDSAFIENAKNYGFKNVNLLQFGYDENLHINNNIIRNNSINFVGSFTRERDLAFQKISNYPMQIHGTKWEKLNNISQKWNISNKKVSQQKIVNIYNSTLATLNVAQKENIINMANMRCFEATACGSCLINDNVKDIELCFEPEKEILIYNSLEELEGIVEKLQKDNFFAKKIAKNGEKRVKNSNYSYKYRTATIMQNFQ